MDDWLQHGKVLEELLEPINDEHMDFKPWKGAMTLSELALHVAGWNEVFVSMVRTEEFVSPEIPECRTMEEVRNAVRNFTKKQKQHTNHLLIQI